jgi:hypothetical protein
MSHQAPTVTQSLSRKLRILDHKYLRTVEPWLPVAVWGLSDGVVPNQSSWGVLPREDEEVVRFVR